jgi:hypothetical protein
MTSQPTGKEVLIVILLRMRNIVSNASLVCEREAVDEKGNEVGVLHPGVTGFSISGARRRAVIEVIQDLCIPQEKEKELIQTTQAVIEKEAGKSELSLEESACSKIGILGLIERAALRLAGIRTVYTPRVSC